MNRLVRVKANSIYFKDYDKDGRFDVATETLQQLPEQMCWCNHSLAMKLDRAAKLLHSEHQIILSISDLFRSEAMQQRAHDDWKTGKKKAYSPPPRSSFHEVGLAVDVNMNWNALTGNNFTKDERLIVRTVLLQSGLTPIAELGSQEEWHYEDRDPYRAIYDQTAEAALKARQPIKEIKKLARQAVINKAREDTHLPPYQDNNYIVVSIGNAV